MTLIENQWLWMTLMTSFQNKWLLYDLLNTLVYNISYTVTHFRLRKNEVNLVSI